MTKLLRERRIRLAEALLLTAGLILLLFVLLCAVEDGAEEATLKTATVDHNRILLILTTLRRNCNNDVLTAHHRL